MGFIIKALTIFTSVIAACHAALYCPSVSDLLATYSAQNVDLLDQGWTIRGGGGVATRASYNLLGGSVSFDLDFSQVQAGVNANLYTISPANLPATGFTPALYCDGAKTDPAKWCTEIDWIESNGKCGGKTTLHTIPGTGGGLCNAWGCGVGYLYGGKSKFSIRMNFYKNGTFQLCRRAGEIKYKGVNFNPLPKASDWAKIVESYTKAGAVLYSSQWVGWVPLGDKCPGGGSLSNSVYRVRNLVINATVVAGPVPRRCPTK